MRDDSKLWLTAILHASLLQVLQAMRDRLVSLQQYSDGTRETVMEVGGVQQSILTRLEGLEGLVEGLGQGGGGSASSPSLPSSSNSTMIKDAIKPLMADITELQSRMSVVQEASLASSKSIEGLPLLLGKRIDETEEKVEEIKAKVSAIGQVSG